MNRYFFENGLIPQYLKNHELLDLVERAIDLFNQQDVFLLINNYHETSISHCLAQHITELIRHDYRFHDMYVDIEYNKGADGNTHLSKVLSDIDGKEHRDVRLDLVVTSRAYEEHLGGFHNLICAEIKKQSNQNREAWDNDRWRLQQLTNIDMTHQGCFGYFMGFFIVAETEKMRIENAYDFLGELPKDMVTNKIYIPNERYANYNNML